MILPVCPCVCMFSLLSCSRCSLSGPHKHSPTPSYFYQPRMSPFCPLHLVYCSLSPVHFFSFSCVFALGRFAGDECNIGRPQSRRYSSPCSLFREFAAVCVRACVCHPLTPTDLGLFPPNCVWLLIYSICTCDVLNIQSYRPSFSVSIGVTTSL